MTLRVFNGAVSTPPQRKKHVRRLPSAERAARKLSHGLTPHGPVTLYGVGPRDPGVV